MDDPHASFTDAGEQCVVAHLGGRTCLLPSLRLGRHPTRLPSRRPFDAQGADPILLLTASKRYGRRSSRTREGPTLSVVPAAAYDAGYRHFANVLAHRARNADRDQVSERVERAFLNLCLEVGPTVSLEIGAHQAYFSRRLKTKSPQTRCLAVEANPYVYEKHAPRLTDAGVEYLHLAVSAVDGTVDLSIPREFHNTDRDRRFSKTRTNRMASLGTHRYAEKSETVSVPSRRLDGLVDVEESDVVVAWIDVEGASGSVLSSGEAVLKRTSLVYIEVESEPLWEDQWLDVDVARFLAGCGLVPVLRDVQRPHQYNVVYAAADLAVQPRMAKLANRVLRGRRGTQPVD